MGVVLPTAENPAKVIHADVLDGLRSLPDGCVQCCVTSPPYWALRDYSVCSCVANRVPDPACRICAGSGVLDEVSRSQIGLEATPDLFVARMVEVFREVRRVLRDDGTLWLNLGDSYASGGRTWRDGDDKLAARGMRTRPADPSGIKPKDLVGIPWRVALALQADGWYLRSDIIWHKPSAMPESVTDRPSKSHEYVFLMSKRERYFYDVDAIREPCQTETVPYVYDGSRRVDDLERRGLTAGTGWKGGVSHPAGRNKRSVWSVVSEGYDGAHFACFPPALVEPMILAGTPEKGSCPACGAPWRRVVTKDRRATRPGADSKVNGTKSVTHAVHHDPAVVGNRDPRRHCTVTQTTGWQPSCKCGAEPVGALVLDPFAGSGTTLAVAVKLKRRAVGIELNADYVKLCEKRLAEPLGTDGLFPPTEPVSVSLYE